jgi:hypothetical protein
VTVVLLERLEQGQKIAAGSAAVLFACMFLSWFNFSFTTSDAWEALNFISPILFLTIVATLGVVFAEIRGIDLGDIHGDMVIFVLGCLSALLILFRIIDPVSAPGIDGGSAGGSVEAGAFLGFIAAVGIAVGGYLATDGKAIDRLKAIGRPTAAVASPAAAASAQEPPVDEPAPTQSEAAPEAVSAPGVCPGCGTPQRPGNRFCRKCGREQDPVAAPTS